MTRRYSGAVTSRDPWLDNTKMVLVTLVVIGHTWGVLASSDLDNWLYDFLYFWHIPAFVFLSGYLSKSFEWDRKHLTNLVHVLLVPYLLFEPALFYFRRAIGQDEGGILWIHPHWAMWYLIVLFWWRLGTPILKRHWLWLPASVAISLAAGLIDGDAGRFFYLSRILGLLPFFVLGLHLKPRHLKHLDDPWVRVTGVAVLVGLLVLARHTDEFARRAFLYYDAGYDDLGVAEPYAIQVRLTVMALGLVGAFAVMSLVPRGAGWFTRMGAATMIVYLLHGFAVKGAGAAGLGTFSEAQPLAALVLSTLGAIGFSMLLASPPARRHLVWVVNPLGTWAARRRSGRDDVPPAPATQPQPRPEPQSDSRGPQASGTAERG
jgi:fucose 4-O-acetylase-like acetyltransferase